MKNYFVPEDGKFRAETVYLSILPKIYPNTKANLSDEEKMADYKQNYSDLPMISLIDFVEPDLHMKTKLREIKREIDYPRKIKKIMTHIPAAIIPTQIKRRGDINKVENNFRRYNSLIALEILVDEDGKMIMEILKKKPWVWYAARSIDGMYIIVIVPLMNKDYRKHQVVYHNLKEELKQEGIVITERCSSLSMFIFQTYDPDAWRNDNCCIYRIEDNGFITDSL